MSTFGISWMDKKMRGTLILVGAIACLFSLIVTKEVQVPKAALYGVMLISGLVVFVKGMKNPEIFTYVLVAYLPYSKVLVGDFGGLAQALNITNLLMGAIILSWVSGRYAEDEPKWLKTPMNAPIIAFILVGMLGISRGGYYGEGYLAYAITEFKRWITPLAMYFLVLNTVKKKNMIQIIIVIMMITTTLVGLMAMYEYTTISDTSDLDKSRVEGIAGHSNTLAAFFCYYMFLPVGFLYMNMNKWRAWLLVIPVLIQFRGIMVTFSRGGYLAFVAGLLGITFIKSRRLFAGLLLFAGLACLFPQVLPSGIRYRMSQTFQGNASSVSSFEEAEEGLEASSKTRIEIWKGAAEMIKDNPLFGVGYGLFKQNISKYWSGGTEIDAHNTYIIITAELGIPALIIFFWMIAVAFFTTWALYIHTKDPFSKAVALGFLGGIGGLMISNMFGSRLNHQEVASYFFILAALVMRLRIIEAKEERMPKNLEGEPLGVNKPDRSGKLDACWFEDEYKGRQTDE